MTEIKEPVARSEVAADLKWDLSTVYATESAWKADVTKAASFFRKLKSFRGKLGKSGAKLLEFIRLKEECAKLVSRTYLYAHLNKDVDLLNPRFKAMEDEVKQLDTQFSTAISFSEPELAAIPFDTIEKFMASTPGLEVYDHYFRNKERMRPHVRSHEVEEVLAQFQDVGQSASQIYDVFSDTEMVLPTVPTADGPKALSQGNFRTFLQNPDANVRRAAFEAMFGTYNKFRGTYAQMYIEHVKNAVVRARASNFKSVREEALSSINMPEGVYDTLIDTVHANVPRLQRYLRLRARILGLKSHNMYDLYMNTIEGVETTVPYAEAKKTVLESVQVLGPEYVAGVQSIFDSNCIDVEETKGKTSGAYHHSVWGTNKFMLLNHQHDVESMFTLGHELGHAGHSLFAYTQPYVYAGYTIFNAEFASTTGEGLLTHHLLKNATDPKMRMYVLSRWLEAVRTTLVRQTLFAEFERDVFARAEAGKPLNADILCKMYRGLVRKYYGPAVRINKLIEIEWARIPHFYNPFYVYTYATGIASATAMVQQILAEGEPAVKRYMNFLKAGKSGYSLDLLKAAGVDMTTPAPIQATFDVFEQYVDELESILFPSEK